MCSAHENEIQGSIPAPSDFYHDVLQLFRAMALKKKIYYSGKDTFISCAAGLDKHSLGKDKELEMSYPFFTFWPLDVLI